MGNETKNIGSKLNYSLLNLCYSSKKETTTKNREKNITTSLKTMNKGFITSIEKLFTCTCGRFLREMDSLASSLGGFFSAPKCVATALFLMLVNNNGCC